MQDISIQPDFQLQSFAGGNPQFQITVAPANQGMHGVSGAAYTDTFTLVPSSPSPALGGSGTFLSLTDAMSYFCTQETVVDAIISALNAFAGSVYYQYSGCFVVPGTIIY